MTLPTPHFAVDRHREGEVEVITVEGDLDVFTTRTLRAALEDVIWRTAGDVVLDLCAAESIDTHGLAAVLNAVRRLTRLDRGLTVVCPPGGARRAFDITGVGRQLTVVDEREGVPFSGRPAIAL